MFPQMCALVVCTNDHTSDLLPYATDAISDAFLARRPHIHSVPADLPHGMRDIHTAVFWAQSPAANDWEAPFVRPDVIQRANHMPAVR
jgi:hypothetical protein